MVGDILFCPKYTKYLNDMLAKKNNAKTDKEKLKIMSKFASKFTLLPEQLSELAELLHQSNKNFKMNNYFCLYSIHYGDMNDKHIEWSNTDDVIITLHEAKCHNRFQLVEEVLSFPHKWLEYLIERCSYFFVYPLSLTIKKQYNSSKLLYNKIVESENDIDKWLKRIKEIENKEAVIANLELKLGQGSNWKNKKLWKFYFGFLKENNRKEILDVFRKYTRLFISDKQAVTQYRNELDKFSSWNFPTTKYWIDTIKYEYEFGTLESAYRILERALKAVMGKPYHFVVKHKNDFCNKLKKFEKEMFEIEELRTTVNVLKTEEKTVSSKPTVYYQNPEKQYLCFHQSFIQNLIKNANGTILRKLYSTCKFFCYLQKSPLCYRLEICNNKETSYCKESLYVNEKNFNIPGNLNLYGILTVEECARRDLIPKILLKLKYCNVRYLFLKKQTLTISDFKMLLSKWLIQISLHDVEIKQNRQVIDVKCFFNLVHSYAAAVEYIEFVTSYLFICCASDNPDWAKRWIPLHDTFQLEIIYLEKQILSDFELQKFINYEMLKNITLQ